MEVPSQLVKDAAIDQLKRILTFPAFYNSPLLSEFLKFIVEETLAGRDHLLKEYTIGTHVLSKKKGYDPQTDASVRIHAGRLRRALNEYYQGPGNNDSIHISVPKGSYVPKFENGILSAAVDNHIPGPTKPTLAVLPFHFQDENSTVSLADGLCDHICTEFSDFEEISIVSYYSSRKIAARATDIKEAGKLLDAKFLLTGSIQEGGSMIRVRVQLIETAKQHHVWASSYEKEKSAANAFLIQDDIVRHVVNQIAGSHGIIFRETAKVLPVGQLTNIKSYDAVFWYYHMVNNQNAVVFEKALNSIKEAVDLDPQYALGWAVLSETYVAGAFNGFDCHVESPLEEAIKCGRQSLTINRHCQHAYQALALAYLFLRRREDCMRIIEQWISSKSNAAAISGGLGFCMICLGEYDRGYNMMTDSIQLNPYYPWWFNAGFSFYHFNRNEYEDAIYWADKLQLFSPRWEQIIKIASYVGMEKMSEAYDCLSKLHEMFPEFSQVKEQYVNAFLQNNISGEFVAAINKVDSTIRSGSNNL